MYLYVELWKPRQAWLEMAREQREEYLSQMRPNIEKMVDSGVKLIGFALLDEDIPNDSQYRYMAVWKMPSRGHVHMLEKAVRAEGWGNFFDIGNARGQLISIDKAVAEMVRH